MDSDSLTFLSAIFSTRFRDSFEKHMAEIGLHSGQVFVLLSLWKTDGQSQADLGKRLSVSPPTIFNMVKRLAENGFVIVKKDEDDYRITRVFLARKGVEIRQLFEEKWASFEQNSFAVLTETERLMFSLLLKKLTQAD